MKRTLTILLLLVFGAACGSAREKPAGSRRVVFGAEMVSGEPGAVAVQCTLVYPSRKVDLAAPQERPMPFLLRQETVVVSRVKDGETVRLPYTVLSSAEGMHVPPLVVLDPKQADGGKFKVAPSGQSAGGKARKVGAVKLEEKAGRKPGDEWHAEMKIRIDRRAVQGAKSITVSYVGRELGAGAGMQSVQLVLTGK